MPAPVISGMINLLAGNIGASIWDGEVPRYDTAGNPINPTAFTIPSDWPVVKLAMKEPGFKRQWNFEDPYDDRGEVLIQVWATTRADVELVLNQIEAFWAQASNWENVQLGGPMINPFKIIQILLDMWYSGQEEGVRTDQSQLLYRGDMHYDVHIHGIISTA